MRNARLVALVSVVGAWPTWAVAQVPVPPAPPAPPDATLRPSVPSTEVDAPMAAPAVVEGPDGRGLGPDETMAAAGPAAGEAPAADPPRQVGRLRAVEGAVTVQSGEPGAAREAAVPNWPVADGVTIAADADGFAEATLSGGWLWLGPHTSLRVERNDASGTLLRLLAGTIGIEASAADAKLEILLADYSAVGDIRGRARIDVAGERAISVRCPAGGRASVHVAGVLQKIGARQRLRLAAGQKPEADPQAADAFDAWWAARRKASRAGRSPEGQRETLRHVSRNMAGYEDLAGHGHWRSTPEYGAVWMPASVAGDWAPYRYGHWAMVPPWGWTWVDDAAWGFAPFHYGRWVFWQNAWGWAPGAYFANPVYAPSLVAWGTGAAGMVSWAPLGWGAAWTPTYPCSYGYAQQLNRPYAHGAGGAPAGFGRPLPRGITQAPGDAFGAGTRVGAPQRPFGPGGPAHQWSFRPPSAPAMAGGRVGAPAIVGPNGGAPARGPVLRPAPRMGVATPAPRGIVRAPYGLPAFRQEPIRMPVPNAMRPFGAGSLPMHTGGMGHPYAPVAMPPAGGHGMPAPHLGVGPGGHGGRR